MQSLNRNNRNRTEHRNTYMQIQTEFRHDGGTMTGQNTIDREQSRNNDWPYVTLPLVRPRLDTAAASMGGTGYEEEVHEDAQYQYGNGEIRSRATGDKEENHKTD